jgi:hypothetical protein
MMREAFLVGRTRLELVTSALSRQRSEPTELTTCFGWQR